MPDPASRPPAARRLGGAALPSAGLALFAYTLRETGLDTVADGFRRVGLAFLAIVVLSGLRFAVRAWAWVLCTEPPHDLRLRDTFPALVSGDALGNLTPLGLFVSEPTKAAFVRDRVSLMQRAGRASPSRTSSTRSPWLRSSPAARWRCWPSSTSPRRFARRVWWRWPACSAFLVGGDWRSSVGRFRPLTWASALLERWSLVPVGRPHRAGKLQMLEDRVYTFARRHPSRPLPILLLEFGLSRTRRGRDLHHRRDAAPGRDRPDAARRVPARVDQPLHQRRLQVRADAPGRGRGRQRHPDAGALRLLGPGRHPRGRPQGTHARVDGRRRDLPGAARPGQDRGLDGR